MGFRSHLEAPFGPGGGSSRFSLGGDFLSDYIYSRGANLLIIELQWDGTGAPTGTLYLLGNADSRMPPTGPDATHDFPIPLPAGSPGTYGAWPNVAGVAGNATLIIKNPAPQHKIGYTFAGGGGGNAGIRLVYHTRG